MATLFETLLAELRKRSYTPNSSTKATNTYAHAKSCYLSGILKLGTIYGLLFYIRHEPGTQRLTHGCVATSWKKMNSRKVPTAFSRSPNTWPKSPLSTCNQHFCTVTSKPTIPAGTGRPNFLKVNVLNTAPHNEVQISSLGRCRG